MSPMLGSLPGVDAWGICLQAPAGTSALAGHRTSRIDLQGEGLMQD